MRHLRVANSPFLCHKPTFVARLIKGCRGDVDAGRFHAEISRAFSTL
jgi:hypothetical protein